MKYSVNYHSKCLDDVDEIRVKYQLLFGMLDELYKKIILIDKRELL